MKKFFKEFKAFIARGNVMDMAVGVIIGGAFSAIVTALTNHILMPIVNWFLLIITGGSGLDSIYTYLKKVETVADGETVIDLTNSIYIDWGAFITAIINFILIALVLFLIIRAINRVAEANKKIKEDAQKGKLTKADKKELKENGVDYKDKAAVSAIPMPFLASSVISSKLASSISGCKCIPCECANDTIACLVAVESSSISSG